MLLRTLSGRKQRCVLITGAQDVEGEPLRALVADARQLPQFFNELSHRLGEFSHKRSGPCSAQALKPSPPSMPPMFTCMASSTLRPASLTAAVTRSCNISTSPDL